MLYFLIKMENELQICPVLTENESWFRLLHESRILVEGSSIPDVLRQFHELPMIISDGISASHFKHMSTDLI